VLYVTTTAGVAAYALAGNGPPRPFVEETAQTSAWALTPAGSPMAASSTVSTRATAGCSHCPPRDNHSPHGLRTLASANVRYRADHDALRVIDQKDREVAALHVKGARSAVQVGDRLALATPEGLVVFDLVDPAAPALRATVPVAHLCEVGRARVAGRSEAVYVRTTGNSGRILDLANAEEPCEIATFQQRPWFVDGVRAGRLYARLDGRRERIRIFRMSGSSTGLERPPLTSSIWAPKGAGFAKSPSV
jgi:hypothetical protein